MAPLVLYLCHEDTEETGSLFEVGGGWVGKGFDLFYRINKIIGISTYFFFQVRWQKSSGAVVKKGDSMTPEDGKTIFKYLWDIFTQLKTVRLMFLLFWSPIHCEVVLS